MAVKKYLTLTLLFFVSVVAFASSSYAAEKKYETWNAIIDEMDVILNDAYDLYFMKDPEKAKARVNNAYFGFYEKHGVERAVMSYISGKRGTDTEYQFAKIKRLMSDGASNKTVRAEIDVILKMLHEDANELDGKKESGWSVLLASFIIIFREGLEAILVIAAISAYLVRSGNVQMVKVVYMSSLFAVFASVLAAIALNSIVNLSGANQEIIEGVAMLLATVVLFFISNWMFSKAEAEAWKNYVEGKVKSAISSGSSIALGFAAFLAVFREGAETILFYQAMLSESREHMDMVWYGLAIGTLVLAIIFIIIRFGTMRLPLKPFFIGTSILMYIMAIAFAGGGVKELQEADIIHVTPVDFVRSIEVLGIYPTVETLLPQIFMVIVVAFSISYYKTKYLKRRKK
ncbi:MULTISPECIES: FTR1 family iron permease [unclassified Gilliamella]|uniref:FTR1 family iron permease n=1 Tax=unclassified Gilliamella TaxID=2685620 RepID=UPI00226A545D|nr:MULTISPECIES: FTR1 family protein [unclassified Gilliamella]MCX8573744.1 FTR1 family iron permease [Gilliamella sp. B3831]MCX8575628.1 FTR1 family iron permease [Gilliamella sp. B3815]MCX8589829.1 FTR1 family iron permease [Gilliamella sp. B3812]MCX8602730.1 FTR1 family iron permease [Gilliamella sp. B3823]MCX8605027.1 FTR1 family iron permease [Gilliamella sp. B3825]